MTSSKSITENSLITWYDKQVESESIAIQRLWDAYFHRMVPLARKKLLGTKRADRDEEDVAISAFQSLCRGLRCGKFNQSRVNGFRGVGGYVDQDSLWPLLVSLTLNKAVDEIRRQSRLKNGGGIDQPTSAPELLDHLSGAEPDPELAAIAEESMQRLMTVLDESGNEDLREIVLASFEGQTPHQIAESLGCSPRTVQRKLRTARALWETASL